MTETEAKTKWCPMARMLIMSTHGQAVVNQFKFPDDPEMKISTCIGSACMMWRKADSLNDSGYCGLAGK